MRHGAQVDWWVTRISNASEQSNEWLHEFICANTEGVLGLKFWIYTTHSMYCHMFWFCVECCMCLVCAQQECSQFKELHWGGLVTTCNQSPQTRPGLKKPHSWEGGAAGRRAYCIIWPLKTHQPICLMWSTWRPVPKWLKHKRDSVEKGERRTGAVRKKRERARKRWHSCRWITDVEIFFLDPVHTPSVHRSTSPAPSLSSYTFFFLVTWANCPGYRERDM